MACNVRSQPTTLFLSPMRSMHCLEIFWSATARNPLADVGRRPSFQCWPFGYFYSFKSLVYAAWQSLLIVVLYRAAALLRVRWRLDCRSKASSAWAGGRHIMGAYMVRVLFTFCAPFNTFAWYELFVIAQIWLFSRRTVTPSQYHRQLPSCGSMQSRTKAPNSTIARSPVISTSGETLESAAVYKKRVLKHARIDFTYPCTLTSGITRGNEGGIDQPEHIPGPYEVPPRIPRRVPKRIH